MKPTDLGTILLTLLGVYFVIEGLDQAFQSIEMYLWVGGSLPQGFSVPRYFATHLLSILLSEFFGFVFLTRAKSLSIRFFGNLSSEEAPNCTVSIASDWLSNGLYLGLIFIGAYFMLSSIGSFLSSIPNTIFGEQSSFPRSE